MKNHLIIGVMGGGVATPNDEKAAYILGGLIAENGWVLLNGGRQAGIMDASAKGAKSQGGLTIGILPDNNRSMASEYIDIPILTGMGNARNSINVLTSDIVVACPGGPGTLSEIALALKHDRHVILFNFNADNLFDRYAQKGNLHYSETPEQVINKIRELWEKEILE